MNLLFVGDCHLRMRPPICRKEKDFSEVCLGKFEQIVGIAAKNDATIIQTGDLFDSPRPSFYIIAQVYKILKKHDKVIHTIYGNHDLQYHSSKSANNSVQRVLSECGVLRVLNESPAIVGGHDVYGRSWNHPEVEPFDTNKKHILVSHDLVGVDKIYEGQKLERPEKLMKRNPGFDIYLVGHYHYSFNYMLGKNRVINPGCILRMRNIEQERKMVPSVVLYDGECQQIELNYNPDVFVEKKDTEKSNENIQEMVKQLRRKGNIGISFDDVLQTIFRDDEIDQNVIDIITQYSKESV